MKTVMIAGTVGGTSISVNLSALDPMVERTLSKELIQISVPATEDDEGQFVYDLSFAEDMFTVTSVLKKNTTVSTDTFETLYEKLFSLAKGTSDYKTFTWGSKEYKVHFKRISVSQRPGRGEIMDLNMQMVVSTE